MGCGTVFVKVMAFEMSLMPSRGKGSLKYCKQRKAASTAGVVDVDEVFHCAGVHGEDRGGLPRRLRN